MKEIKNIYVLFGTLILMLILISTQLLLSTQDIIKKIEQPTKIEKQFVPLTDFELIELAIIWQESKFNSNPLNNDGLSRGLHQELPIYIKEANRIVGYKKYKLSDRTNFIKSHEIFLVVQNHHNPEKSIEKAIKLHNKGAKYFDKVLNRYNCLKLYQEILIFKNK